MSQSWNKTTPQKYQDIGSSILNCLMNIHDNQGCRNSEVPLSCCLANYTCTLITIEPLSLAQVSAEGEGDR